jgi:hexulose-6-phosphate isomerase
MEPAMFDPTSPVGRRQMLAYSAAFGSTFFAGDSHGDEPKAVKDAPRKRYEMKKSINLWAFPYPQKMSLERCLQLAKDAGFDGIELNYDLESDLSPKAGPKEFEAIRKAAERIGIAISGLCSFLFWPYPLSSNDPAKRGRGMELAAKMVEAAHHLGAENLLVVPGAVCIPWRTDHEPVPNDVCDKRAREAVSKLLPLAEKLKVHLNIENIFFNGYLMTPMEMIAFVDSFKSDFIRVHFDTGNIMEIMLTIQRDNSRLPTLPPSWRTHPCGLVTATFGTVRPSKATAIAFEGRPRPRLRGAPETRFAWTRTRRMRTGAGVRSVASIDRRAFWLSS